MSQEFPNYPQQPYSQQSYPGFTPPSQPSNFAPPMQPMQQGYAQPMMPQFTPQPPKKKRSLTWLWILACIGTFLIGLSIGASGHSNASTAATTDTTTQPVTTTQARPTTAPTTAPQKWTTVQTFQGNGAVKTATFAAPDDWKIIWSCDPAQNVLGQYNVIVGVNNSDGTPVDPVAINTICKAGNTSGQTEERQGGNVYLDVQSEDAWTIKIQVLK